MARIVKAGLLVLGVISFQVALWAGTLDDIVSRLDEKGKAFKAKVQTLKIVARTKGAFGDQEVEIENVVYQKGNKLRSESQPVKAPKDIPAEYLKSISIFDGKDLWVISQGQTQRIPVDKVGLNKMNPVGDVDWLSNLKGRLKLVGEETVNGRPCYVLAMDNDVKLYLDKETLDWLKLEQEVGGNKIVLVRSGFKAVQGAPGVRFPRRMEMYLDGEKVADTEVVDVTINPDLPDSLFVVKTAPAPSQPSGTQKGEEGLIESGEGGERGWSALEKLGK